MVKKVIVKKAPRGPQIRLYPYKQGSASAKKLAEAVGGKVLKLEGSKYAPRAGDLVVNWGSSRCPDFQPATTLNSAQAVAVAGCKLKSFHALADADVRIPMFMEDKAQIDMFPVVCRTKLNGHSGEGIVIANNAEELVDAPLYTKYVKKKDEYRVHVVKDGIVFVQRKARKLDVEDPNWQVRNLAGGFAFVEVDILQVPEDVTQQALDAIAALGLDFGGVDVMWNEREGKAYVLEVNTACGLEDRTADKYREAFLNVMQNNAAG